jgi:hypothetical protein
VAPLGAQGRGEHACALGLAGAAAGGEFTVGRSPCLCLADQRDPLVSHTRGREAERRPRAGVGRAARVWARLSREQARKCWAALAGRAT